MRVEVEGALQTRDGVGGEAAQRAAGRRMREPLGAG